MVQVALRDVTESDLPIFLEHHQDADALYMAAFTPPLPIDKDALMSHWRKIFADESNINRTILYDGVVVGHILCFEMFGERNVGYWIDKAYWGKGIASAALRQLLDIVTIRPLYARVVKDNKGSIRVLEKCGFIISGEDTGFANARNADVEEYILKLE